ncbi:MAG: putative FmdB family regulatory protein [Candidatus Azotimanducaceae bacterium]|jgi:putative FmdB family regulatory protein
MPIYEYQCDECHHKFEKLQKFSDEPLENCPACHKPELTKLVSAAGFRLKGDGWYETDFKTGKKKNVAASDTPSSSGSGGSSSSDSSSSGSSSSDTSTPKSAGPSSSASAT